MDLRSGTCTGNLGNTDTGKLNKTGLPSRSEVTDAAHGIMAECILLNKGAHTLKVIKSLKDILSRSGRHHSKKQYTFMSLGIAKNFLAEVPFDSFGSFYTLASPCVLSNKRIKQVPLPCLDSTFTPILFDLKIS